MSFRYFIAAVFLSVALVFLAACDGNVKMGDTGIKGMAVMDGTGAARAMVSVYDADTGPDASPVATTRTDWDGNFSVELPPGNYLITVGIDRKDGTRCTSEEPSEVIQVIDGIAWVGEFELEPESTWAAVIPGTGVTGTVVIKGAPVMGAQIYLVRHRVEDLDGLRGNGEELDRTFRKVRAVTDEDGWFTAHIGPGDYNVYAVRRIGHVDDDVDWANGLFIGENSGNPVTVRAGEYISAGEIELAGAMPEGEPDIPVE